MLVDMGQANYKVVFMVVKCLVTVNVQLVLFIEN